MKTRQTSPYRFAPGLRVRCDTARSCSATPEGTTSHWLLKIRSTICVRSRSSVKIAYRRPS